MNDGFNRAERKIRNAVDVLQKKIEEEQSAHAGQFTLNIALQRLTLQLDLIQRDCKHGRVNEEGCCVICSKYIEK